jgi:signal transduction histidine kinase
MYKWLAILSMIIFTAICGMGWLGYHSIQIWAQGIEGMRIGEFAEVAEQIRQDVNRKLDAFMEQEQNRPYTDYQYYYVPDNLAMDMQQTTLERSPLAGRLEHGLAYYNFQIQPNGRITTPNVSLQEQQSEIASEHEDKLFADAILNTRNVEDNLLPMLKEVESDPYKLDDKSKAELHQSTTIATPEEIGETGKQSVTKYGISEKSQSKRTQNYPIESLQKANEKAHVITQPREFVISNQAQSQPTAGPENLSAPNQIQSQQQTDLQRQGIESAEDSQHDSQFDQSQSIQRLNHQSAYNQPEIPQSEQTLRLSGRQSPAQESKNNLVEIRIEPFVPVFVPGNNIEKSIFDGQVFMLRRVQIEDKSFLQGFQLNEKKLLEEVEESTRRFMREGMSFELSKKPNEKSTHTAILDFVGLGHLILNLMETDPALLNRQISHLQYWYLGIISFVFIAVTLSVGSLWLNARAQIKLAQKKDDFVSAVSHELRTPLTSIRMHAEMLEKDWVKSEDKLTEYYRNMQQESERLSRLIENVLDFSRIQKGEKKYAFKAGDINKCIEGVVEMMTPYATQKGFSIKTELGRIEQTAFDSDVVAQIVVNLLDNAIKYARDAKDKTIIVRTTSNERFILIEVEDHGPGIPHRQREKIFQEFYRIGAEATRETAGSGLGLALVKKFAQAHSGFVEITNAKPTGTIFKVALATRI